MAESWNPPVYVPQDDTAGSDEEFVFESTLFKLGIQCFRTKYDGSVPVKVYDMDTDSGYHTNVGYYLVPDNIWVDAGTLKEERKALAEELIRLNKDNIILAEDDTFTEDT